MSVAEPLIQATLIGEAVDNGPAAIFVADEHGRFVAVNRYACDLLGYTRAELLALGADEIAPDRPLDARLVELARGARLTGVWTLQCRDGTAVELEYRTSRTIVAGMEFYVTIATAR